MPVGVNAFMRATGLGGDPTPQGDVESSKWIPQLLTTAIPFYHEYIELAGIPANQPNRMANQGFVGGERPSGPLNPQVIGSRLASGFGFKWASEKDMFFEMFDLEKYVRELEHQRKSHISEP